SAIDESGASHELSLDGFVVDGERLIMPAHVPGMPRLQGRQGIEIDYVAGFGEAAGEVPADLKQAMLGLVAHWHEHSDAVITAGSGAVVPSGFDRLVAAHKRVRL